MIVLESVSQVTRASLSGGSVGEGECLILDPPIDGQPMEASQVRGNVVAERYFPN